MRFGWWGKLLEVDLSRQRTDVKEISPEDMRTYSGGSGFAARFLFMGLDENDDPLSEKAPMLFMAGLLTGTPAPSASRSTVCARSPLTGIWDESNVGGYWGAELKSAGWDGILVRGVSERPVYLYISDDNNLPGLYLCRSN